MPSIKKRLGRNVKECRKRIGLSQEALAEVTGLSKGSIGLLELGNVWPEFENLQKIAQALSVNVDALFDGQLTIIKPTPEEALSVLADAIRAGSAANKPSDEVLSQQRSVAPLRLSSGDEAKDRLFARLTQVTDADMIASLSAHLDRIEKAFPAAERAFMAKKNHKDPEKA